MPQYVFTMNRVGKIVPPKRQVLKDISLSFFPGARIGVLGLNGSGKSTVLKIMAGLDKDIEGGTAPMPSLNIGYLPQGPQLNPAKAVREEVESGPGEVMGAQKQLETIYAVYAREGADFDKLTEEQARLKAIIAAGSGDDVEPRLEITADILRLPSWDVKIEHLSGGEKHRVALCKLLPSRPDMPLLDEPTNHLDAESMDWLEQFLTRFPGTVVAITHGRYLPDNTAEWILELDRGHDIPWEGNYSSWLDQKETRLKQEESNESARQKALKKELEWVRQSPKDRRAESRARLARFDELNNQEYQKHNETQEIFIPVGERLSNEMIEFQNVSKSYSDRLLIDNLSFTILPDAIVDIIGPNGTGKSTLPRMITDKEQPDSGAIKIGPTVKLAYADQNRDALSTNRTVFEEISSGSNILTVGRYETPSRAYIGRFDLRSDDRQRHIGTLSGGRRGCLHPARTLVSDGSVLLLDEPSDGLDVEALRVLEDTLFEFTGCVMVIPHGRWFLDRIATHIIAFGGGSHIEFFPGNYQEYEVDKKKRLGEEGAKPKRIHCKPITR